MTEEEVVSFLLLFFFFKKLHSLHIHYHKLIFFLSFSDSPCVLLCLFCCSYDSYLSGVTCLAVHWSYITSTINYRLALSSTRYYKSKMKSFDTSSSWSDYSYVGQAPKWILSFGKVSLRLSRKKLVIFFKNFVVRFCVFYVFTLMLIFVSIEYYLFNL